MQNLNEFKLIDGVFTAEEATQVLTALINYKIDYHNREDFAITFDSIKTSNIPKKINQL
jgi:hypothetical protein